MIICMTNCQGHVHMYVYIPCSCVAFPAIVAGELPWQRRRDLEYCCLWVLLSHPVLHKTQHATPGCTEKGRPDMVIVPLVQQILFWKDTCTSQCFQQRWTHFWAITQLNNLAAGYFDLKVLVNCNVHSKSGQLSYTYVCICATMSLYLKSGDPLHHCGAEAEVDCLKQWHPRMLWMQPVARKGRPWGTLWNLAVALSRPCLTQHQRRLFSPTEVCNLFNDEEFPGMRKQSTKDVISLLCSPRNTLHDSIKYELLPLKQNTVMFGYTKQASLKHPP